MRLHDFTIEEINLFKEKKGIYFLIYNETVIYVGQSKALSKRLKQHRSENALQNLLKKIIYEVEKNGKCGNYSKAIAMYDFINKNRNEIKFSVLETEELDKEEEYYITLYKPKYNYKGVDVPYRENGNQEENHYD